MNPKCTCQCCCCKKEEEKDELMGVLTRDVFVDVRYIAIQAEAVRLWIKGKLPETKRDRSDLDCGFNICLDQVKKSLGIDR